ncbi:MAG: catechol 2,3-dioxygenase [Cycloclasticus sp. symbiont of Poecilosclerida sp. M]|nr:MAG: catechol 2,3-dioxygenase [Cycloclasticus sp. symbiont of Poecilosclerida sp. M]
MSLMRVGHVNIRVLDINAATEHYENVLGLIRTGEDADGNIYLKGWDEWDKYSVILSEADSAGMNYVAYKTATDVDIDTYAKSIRDYGIEVEELAAGELPDCGRALRFNLPSGHIMCVFAEKEHVGKAVGTTNSAPWPIDVKGCGVHWLDHVLLVSPFSPPDGINKVAENADFLIACLDFQLTEQMKVGPDADIQALAFLTLGSTPHDIAFVPGPEAGFHHCASYLDGWGDVLKAADLMWMNNVKMDITPNRHGITGGETIYFFDPSGNRNETFAGLGYLAQPDMPVITWTEDQIGTAIFYHSGVLNEEFTSVYT